VPAEKGGFPVAFQLRNDKQVRLSVQAFDGAGHAVHDTFTWSIDDPTVARLTDATEQAVTVWAVTLGRAVVSALDPSGVGAAFEVEVVPGAPASAVITVGIAEPKPVHEPEVAQEPESTWEEKSDEDIAPLPAFMGDEKD
jgi:hypothetical protein